MKIYNKATMAAIAEAKEKNYEKRTHTQRILIILQDGEWHTALELATKVTWKFGSRLSDMAHAGIEYEKRKCPTCPKGEHYFEYRLKELEDEVQVH